MYFIRRLLAAQIDGIIAGTLLIPLLILYDLMVNDLYNIIFDHKYLFLGILFIWLYSYSLVSELILRTTIGKELLKLKIISVNHHELQKSQIIYRNLFRFFDHGMLLGCIIIFFNKYHQRIGDFIANTTVVDKEIMSN